MKTVTGIEIEVKVEDLWPGDVIEWGSGEQTKIPLTGSSYNKNCDNYTVKLVAVTGQPPRNLSI
jgi:hypothetical protein